MADEIDRKVDRYSDSHAASSLLNKGLFHGRIFCSIHRDFVLVVGV